MCINEVSGIGDAIFHLSGLTQRRWSEAEFAQELIRLRLPLYAVAPSGQEVVSKEWVDGKLIVTPRPDLKAGYVTLLQAEIEQLSMGGQTITDLPAWLFGDAPYNSWSEIQTFRASNHRVLNYWDTDEGEWMGQSDCLFFANPIGVTPDTTLVVPRHTIAELVKANPATDPAPASHSTASKSQSHNAALPETDRFGARMEGATALAMAATGHGIEWIAVPDDFAAADMGTSKFPSVAKHVIVRPPDEILGITKTEVVTAFAQLIPIKDLAGALADGNGIYGDGKARVIRGTKDRKHLARWCPIYLAVSYYEMYGIPKKKLNRAFTDHTFLRPWLDTWDEKSESLL